MVGAKERDFQSKISSYTELRDVDASSINVSKVKMKQINSEYNQKKDDTLKSKGLIKLT
jgi:hypothetical protein